MKWMFKFLGTDKDGRRFFTIITDDGKGGGQGISVCHHHYYITKDGHVMKISYMNVPMFKEKPTKKEAWDLMDKVTRHFSGFIPYHMEIIEV